VCRLGRVIIWAGVRLVEVEGLGRRVVMSDVKGRVRGWGGEKVCFEM